MGRIAQFLLERRGGRIILSQSHSEAPAPPPDFPTGPNGLGRHPPPLPMGFKHQTPQSLAVEYVQYAVLRPTVNLHHSLHV